MSRMRNFNFKLTKDQLNSLKKVFKIFDDGTGRIQPKEVAESMASYGIDKTNPVAFSVISSLDTAENKDGIDYEDMIEAIEKKMADRTSDESVQRSFELLVGDPEKNVVTYQEVKRISEEVGEPVDEEDAKNLMRKAADNENDLGYDEFYSVMTRQIKL